MVTETSIRTALAEIKDPEIPTVPITDLGIVHAIRIEDAAIEIDLLPTFAGCPALDVIKRDVESVVRALAPDADVRVTFVRAPAWTTDRLNDDAGEGLRAYGISAPVPITFGKPEAIRCPYCGSDQTNEESAFGPTPCRSVRYCARCRNPFEAFKTKQ